ncbi:DHHC zinc finger domain-containing protein [Cryptosporidium serpentis]
MRTSSSNEVSTGEHFIVSSRMSAQGNKIGRIMLSILPVIYVLIIILSLYCIYTIYHLVPLILYNPKVGIPEAVIFNTLACMVLICFGLSIATPPGGIPDNPKWKFTSNEVNITNSVPSNLKEIKSTGERRYCKWCAKYKPDRTHHCRVCRTCILKMDHHCPWIYNCVGWKNHKYLLLLILYSLLTSLFLTCTLAPTLSYTIKSSVVKFGDIVALLLAEVLAAFLSVLLLCFFVFHMWLVLNGMTTIEFCEKSHSNSTTGQWYKGHYNSFTEVFGENPFLWFLPINTVKGDGTNFDSDEEDVDATSIITSDLMQESIDKNKPSSSDERSYLLKSQQDPERTSPVL